MAPHDIPAWTSEHLSVEHFEHEYFVFDAQSGTMFTCNEAVALILSLCDGKHSINNIVGLLTEAWPEQANDIQEDVYHVVNSLEEAGLIGVRAA